MAAYNPKAGFTLQKPRLPDSTFGMHSSSELYWQSQYMLPVPLSVTAHQGPCSKARLSETLKQSAAAETATASTNRIMAFIGITRSDLRCGISDWQRRPALDLLHVCALHSAAAPYNAGHRALHATPSLTGLCLTPVCSSARSIQPMR